MQQRQIGTLAIVAGVLAILLALLADTLGIGGGEGTFGWKQIVLLIVGVALNIGGLLAIRRAGEDSSDSAQTPAG